VKCIVRDKLITRFVFHCQYHVSIIAFDNCIFFTQVNGIVCIKSYFRCNSSCNPQVVREFSKCIVNK